MIILIFEINNSYIVGFVNRRCWFRIIGFGIKDLFVRDLYKVTSRRLNICYNYYFCLF